MRTSTDTLMCVLFVEEEQESIPKASAYNQLVEH